MLENKINELLESVSVGLQESLLTDSISSREYNCQTVDYYNVYNEICKNEFDFRIVLESNTGITVKPENVIKYLKWKLKLKNWQFTVNSGYNNVPSVQAEYKNDKAIFINIPTINKNESIIKEILERFGYYWSNSYKSKGKAQGVNWVVMVFYPLYLDNINDKVKKYKYIYHITEEKNVDDILTNGFIPFSKSSRFNYPNRCHFFIGDKEEAKLFVLELERDNNADYVLFTLDTSKIDNDFYPDPNIRNCVITKDTVSPETIVKYEKI